MRRSQRMFAGASLAGVMLAGAAVLAQQTDNTAPDRTMRPVVRGVELAVSSMKPEATQAAVRILEAGGNAFDAAAAGRAVLGLTDPAMNGIGSDAVVLIYDARTKQVLSINAEGTAPKLATIEWYQKNHRGELPRRDGLLSGTVPGVVDAWYVMLDRWGTMSFAQVLQPAIEMAERGFPLSESLARSLAGSEKLRTPRWSTRSFPTSSFPHTMRPGDLSVAARIADPAQKALADRGHKLQVARRWSLGSNAAIVVDPETGVLSAGADPRVDAYAWAR